MKITKQKLTQIIREELQKEMCGPPPEEMPGHEHEEMPEEEMTTVEAIDALGAVRPVLIGTMPELLDDLDYVLDKLKTYEYGDSEAIPQEPLPGVPRRYNPNI